MKTVSWVTPSYFLDTDIFIVEHLSEFFTINWYILRAKNIKLDFQEQIEKLAKHPNINIQVLVHERNRAFFSQLFFHSKLQKMLNVSDVIYQPCGLPYSLPAMLLFGNKKKTIVPIHNVNTPKGGHWYLLSKMSGKITRSHFLNFATFSKSQYNLLKSVTKNKRILYAPFYLKDYGKANKKRTSDYITFMNFGIIREYKRIDVLINAAQQAYERTGKLFRVIVAGSCTNWAKYQEIIKYPMLFDLRITRVDDCEIPNLFEECDYFVTPYQDIAQSGSLIVAINYNKPIVASKLEAFEEYVEDGVNGYLIKPADVEDLCDKMTYILEHHDSDYKKLKENQKEMINREFSPNVISNKIKRFIETL